MTITRELDGHPRHSEVVGIDGGNFVGRRSSFAYWISFSRWRWKFLIESVVALPLVLPPTVLGFYILVAIGPHSPVGRFYADLVGHQLPFTIEGLLFASVLYSLPFAVQPFASSFDQVDRRLIEAS